MTQKMLMIISTMMPHLAEADFEFMAANDWVATINIYAHNGQYGAHTADFLSWAQEVADYGIPIVIDLESPLSYALPFNDHMPVYSWYDTPASWYESNYGAMLDTLEDGLGSSLIGYYWEEAFLIAFDWLVDRCAGKNLKLMQGIGGIQFEYNTPNFATGGVGGIPITPAQYGTFPFDIEWGFNELDYRCENVDLMIPQLWFTSWVHAQIAIDNYVHENHPTCGRGFQGGWDYPGSYGDFSGFWTVNGTPTYTLTWDEQIKIMMQQFALIKEQASTPEYVQLQVYPDAVHPVSDYDVVVKEIIGRPIPTSQLELVNLAT